MSGGAIVIAQDKDLTEADYRKLATWSTESMDAKVDLTGDIPKYSGTLKLKSNAKSSFGPTLVLSSSDAEKVSGDPSIKLLELRIIGSSIALPKHTIEIGISNPVDKVSRLATIRFESPVPIETEIEVSFTSEFVSEQGQIIHRPEFAYNSWTTSWYPTTIADAGELVTMKSLSFPGQITFMLAKDWNALSNGKLIADNLVGDFKEQIWKSENAIAWGYVAAPYSVSTIAVGDIDVSMYMLYKTAKVVKDHAIMIAKLVHLLEGKFGPYPFKTFGLAEMPDQTSDYFGAASEQGYIVAESKNFTNDFGLTLFSHEVGHAWWGNKFSCSGEGASLCSEALAQVGTILGTELIRGKQAMINMMDVSSKDYTPYQSARGFFAVWRNGDDLPLSEVNGNMIHRMMDSKGMWFWQMLRNTVGDEKFFKVLRNLSDGKLSKPTLVELEAYFSEQTNKDLGYFFEQWLNRKGAPVIDITWQANNPKAALYAKWWGDKPRETIFFGLKEKAKTVEITLVQEQKELYRVDLEIEIQRYYEPSIIKHIEFSERTKIIKLDVEGIVKDVILDPEHKILMWRPAYGPKPDLTK